jgi:hypothetical protein
MSMMETITKQFDETNKINPDWYAKDTYFAGPDGSRSNGVDEVLASTRKAYEPFVAHYHEPQSIMCVETENGYKMLGQAKLYGNLPGVPAEGEEKVHDKLGRAWDVVMPGGWFNWYEKDDTAKNGMGLVIKGSEAMTDGRVPLKAMFKRGLITAAEVGLA